MADPLDLYADQFQVVLGPFGSTCNFLLSNRTPPAPGSVQQAERVASIRMSVEHLKLMAFILRRQIIQTEKQFQVEYPVPVDVLRQLQIPQEDWVAFWQH